MSEFKSLITITTCNRLDVVKLYIWDYIRFCNTNEGFDFLLALDGNSSEYKQFCDQYHIPLLYSDEREGVGLSKNRVLKQFSDYDYYFFIEDDIELINPTIFVNYIKASKLFNIEHLNHFGLSAYNHHFINEQSNGDYHLVSKQVGGGYFNFFTKKGIEIIGGFHTEFAKYKRFGHTEHTVRFVNAGLQTYRFNSVLECQKDLLIHFPPHVTPIGDMKFVDNLSKIEKKIIDQKLKHYSITTITNCHYNGFAMQYNANVETFLSKQKQRYPLTIGKARSKALSEFFFFKFRIHGGLRSIVYLFRSFIFYPMHPDFKHYMKTKLKNNDR